MESLTMKGKGRERSLSRDESVEEERGVAPLILNFIISWTWSVSRFGRSTASIHWVAGWVGPWAGVDVLEKRKIRCSRDDSNHTSFVL